MKAALYVRVSDDTLNLANQRAPLEQLAAARGWEPVWYEEVETADSERARRPVFARLWEDARKGRVQVVAVVALDRLTRRVNRLLELFADADRWKVRLVSLRERENWTDMDARVRDFVLHGLGLAAEWELENLRDRTRKGLARARREGTKSGKPIGRPRANQLLLGAAARRVHQGASPRQAAKDSGVSESSLRRYLKALAAPRNDEGPGGRTNGAPEPSSRQNPPVGGATGRHQESTG